MKIGRFMKRDGYNKGLLPGGFLLSMTTVSIFVLSSVLLSLFVASTDALADDVIDEVTLSVPICRPPRGLLSLILTW